MKKTILLTLAALFLTAGFAFAEAYDLGNCSTCKDWSVGNVDFSACVATQDSPESVTGWFDIEWNGTSTGYTSTKGNWCNGTTNANFLRFSICDCVKKGGKDIEVGEKYRVTAEIVTPGVYFLSDNPTYNTNDDFNGSITASKQFLAAFYNSSDLLCNATVKKFGTDSYAWVNGSVVFYDNVTDLNVTTKAISSSTAYTTNFCKSEDTFWETQSRYLITSAFTMPAIDIDAAVNEMLIDLPGYFIDPSVVKAGTAISVKIGLAENGGSACPTCGDCLCRCEQTIAIVGCTTSANEICFPYFTALDESSWWNGIAVLNPNSSAVSVTITFKAGTESYETEQTIAGGEFYVDLLSNILPDTFPTDLRVFVEAESDGGGIDGFAMLGDGTQAQGYLPRQAACGTQE